MSKKSKGKKHRTAGTYAAQLERMLERMAAYRLRKSPRKRR